jgi:hypothetical protein
MFSESNTVEQMIFEATAKLSGMPASMVHEDVLPYVGELSSDDCTWHPGQSGQTLRVR